MDVRQTALKSLIEILEKEKFYDQVFEIHAQEVNNPSELTNIVSGAVKSKLTLDYFISQVSSKNIKRFSPVVRNILRLGIFELEYLKRPDYAVVNSYVDIIRKLDKNSVGFVNAILRNFIRKRAEISLDEKKLGTPGFLSIKYSHPEWLVQRWLDTYGKEETEKICEYNNRPPKIILRINTLKISKENLLNLFTEAGICFEESFFSKDCIVIKDGGNIKNIPGYDEGYWIVQGEPSSMVSEILNPMPDEKILDLCAAPGSKTCHIAALMENKGEITAVDISAKRTKKIAENCKRLGVTSVKTIVGNAAELQFDEKFDRILVDAPCSNTGVLVKRPDARWQKKPEDINSLAQLQFKILNNAAGMLKAGGVLVYSTCSIEPEENILLIERFLEENKDFELEKFNFNRAFKEDKCSGMLQILQSKHNIDGFFIAKMKKK